MRILVVEDDTALGLFLGKGLKLEGHEVEVAGDGHAAVDYVLEHRPDLMVLDLGLPKKDGMAVLEELQGRVKGLSILVLTGRSGLNDRIQCLNLGADDCLLKPFSFTELTARVRALLRRRVQSIDTTLRHGALELDRMRREVRLEGRTIELTGKEFALLEFLMQARGRVCGRGELLREVWQMSPDAGTNVVDVYVNYLRKKLMTMRPDGTVDTAIETVRGEGYFMSVSGMKRPSIAASAHKGLEAPRGLLPHGMGLKPVVVRQVAA